MSDTRAYLSLGSNLADRLDYIARAIAAIGARDANGGAHVTIARVSPVYETAALGPDGQVAAADPAFLNCAVAVDTDLSASLLRQRTSAIERMLGRGTSPRWSPRVIDIDLVLFGDEQLATPSLMVPHPRMRERAFVLKPLLDLDPALAPPGIGPLAPLLPAVAWQSCVLHTTAADLRRLVEAARAPTPA